jgi:hypothetical protein
MPLLKVMESYQGSDNITVTYRLHKTLPNELTDVKVHLGHSVKGIKSLQIK